MGLYLLPADEAGHDSDDELELRDILRRGNDGAGVLLCVRQENICWASGTCQARSMKTVWRWNSGDSLMSFEAIEDSG